MFKPQTFRLANTIHWPGAGPTNEIHTDHISTVKDEGDAYTFAHASGYAVKIPKNAVTSQGIWDDDDIPNLPSEDDDSDDDSAKSTRLGGHRTPLPGPIQDSPQKPESGSDTFFDGESLAGGVAGDPDNTGDSDDTTDSDADKDAYTDASDSDVGSLSSAAPTDDTDYGTSDDTTSDESGTSYGDANVADDFQSDDQSGTGLDESADDQTSDEPTDDDLDATDDQSQLSDVLDISPKKKSKKSKK